MGCRQSRDHATGSASTPRAALTVLSLARPDRESVVVPGAADADVTIGDQRRGDRRPRVSLRRRRSRQHRRSGGADPGLRLPRPAGDRRPALRGVAGRRGHRDVDHGQRRRGDDAARSRRPAPRGDAARRLVASRSRHRRRRRRSVHPAHGQDRRRAAGQTSAAPCSRRPTRCHGSGSTRGDDRLLFGLAWSGGWRTVPVGHRRRGPTSTSGCADMSVIVAARSPGRVPACVRRSHRRHPGRRGRGLRGVDGQPPRRPLVSAAGHLQHLVHRSAPTSTPT